MGDSISDIEKEALKIVVYSEFIALVKSHRHELRCKAHSIQSAEKVSELYYQCIRCI